MHRVKNMNENIFKIVDWLDR